MLLDNELVFADGTWAPTANGDNVSTNVYDAGIARDLGQGEQLVVAITVRTAVTAAGAATVDFRVRTDSAANLTTAPVDLVSTGPIAKTALVAGYQVFIPLPSGNANAYKRFIGVNANIATGPLTAGAFHVAIVKDKQKNVKYASGYTV